MNQREGPQSAFWSMPNWVAKIAATINPVPAIRPRIQIQVRKALRFIETRLLRRAHRVGAGS